MSFEVVMPRLGWNMEEGALAGWRKKDGESVTAGEILFEVESDKAIQEVEALESGILRMSPDSPPLGKLVPVGTLLAYLVRPGEPIPAAAHPLAAPSPAAPAPAPVTAPVSSPRSAGKHPAASPRAKRVAGELGVDWRRLAGTGRTGRIVERDVRRAAASPRTTAAVTLTTEADATEMVRLRTRLKSGGTPPVPSYEVLLAKLAACALTEHPQLNARSEGGARVSSAAVNIGIAVDTERGLVVPVVRDAHAKPLRAVAREFAELIARARAGRSSPEDLRGGTFTVTNLGMHEIDAFTPIINPPECAILGVGRIVAKQVVTDPEAQSVAIRQMVFLSLSFDNRLVDSAPAAKFLQKVKRYVEMPYLWLAGA